MPSSKPTRPYDEKTVRVVVLLATLALPLAQPFARAQDVFTALREEMVRRDLIDCGIRNPRVLEAMRTVPRHEFVPPAQRTLAYYDMALPIGFGQTISATLIVAYMTEQLDPQPDDKVLEIGTGSGYQAAVLSGLVREVYSIEIIETEGPSYCPPAEVFKELIPNNRFELDEDNNGVPDYWVPGDTPSVVRQSATGCEALGARGTKALWVTGGSDRGGEWSVHIPEVEPDKYYLVAFQLFRDAFQNGWYPEIELFDKRYIMNQHATFGKWQAIELVIKDPSDATSTTFRFVNHNPCTLHGSSRYIAGEK